MRERLNRASSTDSLIGVGRRRLPPPPTGKRMARAARCGAIMIETSNPAIDIDELMERVRAEAAKLTQSGDGMIASRRPLALTLPPIRVMAPPPRLPALRSPETKKERIDTILRQAREKSDNPAIPKIFRGLFRKQGGYNRLLIDAVDRLSKTQAQMAKHVREVSNALETQSRWMRALAEHRQSDATWMRAAAQQISDLALDLHDLAAATDGEAAPAPGPGDTNDPGRNSAPPRR